MTYDIVTISFTIIGIYLSLGGRIYSNNSIIPITDIIGRGTSAVPSDNALQCITDKKPCCYEVPNRHGEWYYPDGSQILYQSYAIEADLPFFRNRGDDGTVNLNRVNSRIMFTTGKFCCVVPNSIGVYQTLCAYLSKILLLILYVYTRFN